MATRHYCIFYTYFADWPHYDDSPSRHLQQQVSIHGCRWRARQRRDKGHVTYWGTNRHQLMGATVPGTGNMASYQLAWSTAVTQTCHHSGTGSHSLTELSILDDSSITRVTQSRSHDHRTDNQSFYRQAVDGIQQWCIYHTDRVGLCPWLNDISISFKSTRLQW